MVVKLLALYMNLLLVVTPPLSSQESTHFYTECTKREVFVGEQLACNFIVAAQEDLIEVEVAKFPEFRGYWSENVALRQGPVPLLGFPNESKKAIVGTYLLSSMIGKSDAAIIPMKIVVRRPYAMNPSDREEKTFLSEPPPLKLLPLPRLPSQFLPEHFFGAVGIFSVSVEPREVPFQRDEPISLRITLQGEGNFQEINEIRLAFPPQVETLSRRATSQGSGQFTTKVFELTLFIHSAESFTVKEQPFIFFNPTSQKYETLMFPSMAFRHVVPTQSHHAIERPRLSLGPAHKNWSSWHRLAERAWYWALQGGFVLTIAVFGISRTSHRARRRRWKSHRAQRRIKHEIALHALETGNLEAFLRLSDELAREILTEQAGLPPGLTQTKLIVSARKKLDPEIVSSANIILQSHDAYSFSPFKRAQHSPEILRSRLDYLIQVSSLKKKAV